MKKIIYRKALAYNHNTGKKMFCIEALVDGRWMPAVFENGLFLAESSTVAQREVMKRNRISFGKEKNPLVGIPDKKTEKEIAYLIAENERLSQELTKAQGIKPEPSNIDDEDRDFEKGLFMSEEEK